MSQGAEGSARGERRIAGRGAGERGEHAREARPDGPAVRAAARAPRRPAGRAAGAQKAERDGASPRGAAAVRATYRQGTGPIEEQEVLRYLPLVKHVAARLAMGLPGHIEMDDLHSYGIFGLLDALQKFDASRGVKFETYAFTRIRGAILDGLRAMDWVPTSMRQRARQVEDAFARVEARVGRSAEDAEVAEELGLDLNEFHRLMRDMERASVLSLDELWGEERGEAYTLRDLVRDDGAQDPTESAEWRNREEILAAAIETLPERERTVLTLFYYDGLVPKEIAAVLGVSVSRISQLHSRAVMRLKGRLAATQRSLL